MTAEDQTRQSYKQLDAVLTTLRNNSEKGFNKNRSPDDVIRTTPERAQAIAKIKEALDWLTKDLKALVKPSPGAAPNPNNYCTSSCSSGSSQSSVLNPPPAKPATPAKPNNSYTSGGSQSLSI